MLRSFAGVPKLMRKSSHSRERRSGAFAPAERINLVAEFKNESGFNLYNVIHLSIAQPICKYLTRARRNCTFGGQLLSHQVKTKKGKKNNKNKRATAYKKRKSREL